MKRNGGFNMLENRRRYIVLTSALFGVGFVLYGSIGLLTMQYDFDFINISNPWLRALAIALLGGYLFSSLMSGIIVVTRFISKRSFNEKIILAIFFVVPMYIVLGAAFYSIPYGIYNFIKYRQLKNNLYSY